MMHATGGADKTLPFTVVTTDWHAHRDALSAIRRKVFIEEQNVPEALEWDDGDASATHLLAFDLGGNAIGCARLLSEGRIGRMAVLSGWRGRGVGRALLDLALEACREQCHAQATISSQTHAIGFYEQRGFRVCSEVYDDAGIPHRDMVLTL